MLLFLKLYLSHLIADFLLQPNRIAKKKRSAGALLAHSGIHIGVALAIVNVDLDVRIASAITILAVAHAVCDYVKARFTKDEWWAFAIDQLVHCFFVAIAALWLTADGLPQILTILRSSRRLYLLLCVYIAVVLGGGYFVQKVSKYFIDKIDESVAQSKPGLPAAGKYIGWLERSLVLTFLITGYPEGIGLLLAAKALVRYPEIKEDQKGHFAEYFLIGTLTSVSIALIGGLIARTFLARF